MNRNRFAELLQTKLEVLEQISRNNETQSRFISRWEMKGLRRLLRERAELINQLAALDREMPDQTNWEADPELAGLTESVQTKQLAVLNGSRRIIKEAIAEREKIGAALNEIRKKRQARNSYQKQWENRSPGVRLNIKG